MDNIRAFVGHSFSERDKPLVRVFLDHFSTLEKGYPGFSWDHAEEAEAGSISEKILRRIEGKNVFIGICTRHERALRTDLTKPSFLHPRSFIVKEEHTEWKASDWIIQEIGLAVGRGMIVILFMEHGVRPAGGLFSDVEYVPFTRERPHESFDKFFQMLTSLRPKDSASLAVDGTAGRIEEKAQAPECAEGQLEPDENWTAEQFRTAAITRVSLRQYADLDKLSTAFRATIHAAGNGAAEWDGYIEWLKMIVGSDVDFDKLQRLADTTPTSASLQDYLGRAFLRFKEFGRAAHAFERAAAESVDLAHKLSFKGDAASAHARAGNIERALDLFEGLKKDAKVSPRLISTLGIDLRSFAEIEKNDSLEVAVMEHMVALEPADPALRFAVAYKHSQLGNEDLALDHYLRIPDSSRNSMAWNNLGVSLGNFNMPISSINAFKRAESEGNTLAMSNLGFKLISSGFLPEARELATRALMVEDFHENIADLMKRVKQDPIEEEKKQKDLLEKVVPKAAFYKRLGEAAFDETYKGIEGAWKGPECLFSVHVNEGQIHFVGSFEVPSSPLGGLVAPTAHSSSKSVLRHVKYTLKIYGRMLAGSVRRKTDGETPSLISLATEATSVLMYIDVSDAPSLIQVMEGGTDSSQRFYSLERVSSVDPATS